MFWPILTCIVILGLIIYLYYMRQFALGLGQDAAPDYPKKPFVSVIIAARNEEKNLPHLPCIRLRDSGGKRRLYRRHISGDSSLPAEVG